VIEHRTVTEPELISVVIPARNSKMTLAQTLDSLLAQGEPRWQAYLVDDGSTDGTGAIMTDYAARDARFTILAGPSAGVSRARNVALPLARGRWLHFLDSDDWVTPDFYEKMLRRLEKVPDAVAGYCGYRRVMPDGSMTWMFFAERIAKNAIDAFARGCDLHLAGLLLSRAAVEKVGYFDPSLIICEDWDLFQRAARLGGSWVSVAEPLAFYRMRAGSLSRNLARMDMDMRRVITRGFRADERLAGMDLAHPEGADDPGGEADSCCAVIALWLAAQSFGTEGAAAYDAPTFRALPKFGPAWSYHPNVMVEGLVFGERVTADRLAASWPFFAERVTRLIALLGEAWEDPDMAYALRLKLEETLLDHDGLVAPRAVGLTLGIRMDMLRLGTVNLPDGVERAYVYIMRGKHYRGAMKCFATGHVKRRQWLELMLAHFQSDGAQPFKDIALLRCLLIFDTAMAVVRQPLRLWQCGLHGIRALKGMS
jgi:glycosyltransferase involved in cell wall biosynthesis